MSKLCEFENCEKEATYGYYYGQPDRCRKHKEDRKYQYMICMCGSKEPRFDYPNETKAKYCNNVLLVE